MIQRLDAIGNVSCKPFPAGFEEAQGRPMAVVTQWPAQRVAQAISWSGIQVRQNAKTKHAQMSTKRWKWMETTLLFGSQQFYHVVYSQ